jgi:hypothetical protein
MKLPDQSYTDNTRLSSNNTLSSPGKNPAQSQNHSARNELLWIIIPTIALLGPFAIPGISMTTLFLIIIGICYAVFLVLMFLAVIQNLTRKSGSRDRGK